MKILMHFKYHLISFCLALGINSLFAQKNLNNNGKPHGTLIVSLICKDGILIASDSRASFTIDKVEEEIVYAYIENQQKIFSLKNFKMGMSGVSMIGKKFLFEITEDFNKKLKKDSIIEYSFRQFLNYLNTELDVQYSTIFKENQFILAGYENSQPLTLGLSSKRRVETNKLGGMIHSDSKFKGYLSEYTHIDLTCKNFAPLLESAMYKFAKDRNDNKIGGPIHIIQISPNNSFIEIKSLDNVTFKNYKEFAEAIINNKLKVKYLFSYSEELLKKTLKEGIKLGY